MRFYYPTHQYWQRAGLSSLAFGLATFHLHDPWPLTFLLVTGGIYAISALHRRGQWLSFQERSLDLNWRSHKLTSLAWSEIQSVQVCPRGTLWLRDTRSHMRLGPSLEGFGQICTAILRYTHFKAHIPVATSRYLLRHSDLANAELLPLFAPRFLAEPSIHAYLWDSQVDPYMSWQAIATALSLRWIESGRQPQEFVLVWDDQGRVRLQLGRQLPSSARAWARSFMLEHGLCIEVDYEGYGVRRYEMIPE